MAFSPGLPACLADMEEYCAKVLGVRVEPIDMQWIARAVFNRLPILERYTYCLYALKCGGEGRPLSPPGYYKGIRYLSSMTSRLLKDRAAYWKRQARTLYFVQNISFGSLFCPPPASTRDQSTATGNEFAEPQDVRQRPGDDDSHGQGVDYDARNDDEPTPSFLY